MYKHTCQEISNSELITLAQTSHQQAAPHICRSKGKNRTIKRPFFVSTLCRDRLAGSPSSSGGGSHRKKPSEILSATENTLAWKEAESQPAEFGRKPLYCGGRSKYSHTSHVALRTKFQLVWPQPATSTHLHWHFHAPPKAWPTLEWRHWTWQTEPIAAERSLHS